jgi:hypothetical protein
MTIPKGMWTGRYLGEFVDWIFLIFVLIPAVCLILIALKLLLSP